MICEKCGVKNADRFKFCVGCGAGLKTLSAEESEPTTVVSKNIRQTRLRRKLKQAELLVGQTLDGKYRLNAVIETNGTVAMYNATRLKVSDEVAIKIFNLANGLEESESADRFMREAQIAARFKHPSAVVIYDFDVSENNLFYIVMELAVGENLRQIIKKQGTMPPSTVCAIAEQVCDALDEAHQQGIVHGDIKPENIFVNHALNGLRVKVLDFGLAEMNSFGTGDLTELNAIAGTPNYMSPEQSLGEELDGRSDIYSFGVVLYEMLGGAVPFNAPKPMAVIARQITQPPASLRLLNSNVPPLVEAVVMRSLQKQPDARQSTAADLAQELHNAVSGTTNANQVHSSAVFKSPSVIVAAENLTSANSPANQSTPVSDEQATIAALHYDAVNEKIGVPSFGPNYAEKTSSSSKLLLIGGITLALLLLPVFGAILWWQTQKSDARSANDNRTVSNSTANSNASDENLAPQSAADDEFKRLQAKFSGGVSGKKASALEREIKDAESKYPEDYRFTYQKAKIETVNSKEHHEAFEMLYGAGEKAIKAGKSADLLSNLQKDKKSDLKRLADHEEWTVLENALRKNDAEALEVSGH